MEPVVLCFLNSISFSFCKLVSFQTFKLKIKKNALDDSPQNFLSFEVGERKGRGK